MYRSDENQAAIVDALRKAGAVVYIICGANGRAGVPDLLVAARKQTFLLEVKRPLGPKGGGAAAGSHRNEVKPAQREFAEAWVRQGGPCGVVRSPEEAMTVVFGGVRDVRL